MITVFVAYVSDSTAFVSRAKLFSPELMVKLINEKMPQEAFQIFQKRVVCHLAFDSDIARGVLLLLSRSQIDMLAAVKEVFAALRMNNFYPKGVVSGNDAMFA